MPPRAPSPGSGRAASAVATMASMVSVPSSLETLENGLRVLFHEDRRLPVVHVALWYHVGSANERPWRTGFAHLFEHLMFEGSRHNNRHFIRLMEKAGASLAAGGVNGTTSHDRTNYYETVPREALGLVLWAESDRMAYLLDVLDQSRLDTQREVVRNERFQRMDNVPYGTAWEILFRTLFPAGHPYSWDVIGDMGQLAASDLGEVHDFFRTWYVPNNAVLVVAGDFRRRRARELVRRYFGPIPPGPTPGRPAFPRVRLPETRRIAVPEAVPQARLYAAWPTPPFFDPDEAPLDMLANILSDGLNSRLYRRMVHEDRTASNVSAFHHALTGAGIAGVVATARPDVPLERLRAAMDEEIVRMAETGPTDDELARVKASAQVAFLAALERLATKADLLARYTTFLGDPDRLGEDWVRFRRVSSDDVRRVAREYLLAPRIELLYGAGSPGGGSVEDGEPPPAAPVVGPDAWSDPAAGPGPEPATLPPEPDRERPPRRGRAPKFAPELPQIRELRSGMRLHLLPRRDLPHFVAGLSIPGGKAEEPRRLAGLAGITAAMMSRGTTSRTAREFEAEADRAGAAVRATAGPDWFGVHWSGLTEHTAKSFDLAADLLRNPAFPEPELARMVPVRLDGLKQARANPTAVAQRIVQRSVFSTDHPYGWRGDEETLPRITTDDLTRFHRARFAAPDGAERPFFVACGDFDPDEVEAAFERVFGGWCAEPGETRADVPAPRPVESGALLHAMEQPGPQAVVTWRRPGPPRGFPGRYALRLALTVLGGGFSSRLNLNLRERMGATYGAFAGWQRLARGSMFTASASLNLDRAGEGIRELLAEVEALASGRRPVRVGELRQAKQSLIRGYAQVFETIRGVRGAITGAVRRGDGIPWIREYASLLEAVTPDEATEAARTYLGLEGSALVVVGDGDALEPELAGLPVGPVVRVDAEGSPL